AELADLAGLKITHMSKLENNSGDPKLSTLYKLMTALDCSADTLLMDIEKLGVDGLLRVSFDRATQLPRQKKAVVIDLIDNYCTAAGMEALFSKKGFLYRDGPTKPISQGLTEDAEKSE